VCQVFIHIFFEISRKNEKEKHEIDKNHGGKGF